MEDPGNTLVPRRRFTVAAFVFPAILAVGPSLPPASVASSPPAPTTVVDDLAEVRTVFEALNALAGPEPCDETEHEATVL